MPERRLTQAQKKQVAARFKWTCAICRQVVDETFQIDHIVPLWGGGTDDDANLQLLCARDHAKKTYDENTRRHVRARRPPSTPLRAFTCNACGTTFSPYFEHRCRSATSRPPPPPPRRPVEQDAAVEDADDA